MSLAEPIRRSAWPRPCRTLHVLLAARSVQWGVSVGRGRHLSWVSGGVIEASSASPTAELDGAHAPLQPSLNALAQWLNEPWNAAALSSVRQMRVCVSDALIAVGTVPWSGSLGHSGSAAAAARRQLANAGFELPHDDGIRLDDTPYGAPRLAVAYPAALMRGLDAAASQLRIRRWSVLPVSVAAWHGCGPASKRGHQAGALAIVDDGHVTLVRGGRSFGLPPSTIGQVDVRPLDIEQPLDAALHAVWQRVVLREPVWSAVGTVDTIQLSPPQPGGPGKLQPPFRDVPQLPCASGSGTPVGLRALAAKTADPCLALDARPCAPAVGPGRWLGLAVCVGAMAWAALFAAQTTAAERVLAAQLGRAERAQPAAAAQPVVQRRDEVSRIQSVNAAIQALNLPIGALLRALQPPRDIRVAVLGVETQAQAHGGPQADGAGFNGLKVRAEAESSAEMARYVAFVAERKPFYAAYLESHEVVADAGAPGPRYRFTLDARWKD